MEKDVNNSIYELYGERWYTAYDDPIALLRAESRVKNIWIKERISRLLPKNAKLLDVGCGAGFLTNELAQEGLRVTGVDLSGESLQVARAYDKTKSVRYLTADAYALPFPDETFDVLCAMDFLEHVDDPDRVIQEFSRVLKKDGLFFYHTFNRNPLSWLVIIKFVEWFVKNTPPNMHVLRLFIRPKELEVFCERARMSVQEVTGIRPVLTSIPLKSLFTGIVPEGMRFTLTRSTLLSYLGMARKKSI